jgi:hypothetical protein
MAVSSEIWNQLATTGTSITATPPPTRGSFVLNDYQALIEVNFADYQPPDGLECSALLQAFLDYAGTLAFALKANASSLDDQNLRNCVRATIPRGNYQLHNQIVVPEFVELNCLGTLWRQSGGFLDNNYYQPMVVFTINSMARFLNLYCQDNTENTGAGVVFGKSWEISGISSFTGTSGYAVNDEIVLSNPSQSPSYGARLRVTSVGGGGAITGVTVLDGGAYSRRPNIGTGPYSSAGQMNSVSSGSSRLFLANTLTQASTTGSGTATSFTPTWAPDFYASPDINGFYTYRAGPPLQGNMYIGEVTVKNVDNSFSPTYGGKFGVLLNLFNADIDRIQVVGGYYGIAARCTDVRANSLNLVLNAVGMACTGTSFSCPDVVCDTCSVAFIEILPGSGSVNLSGHTIWPDPNESTRFKPIDSGYGFLVGQDSGDSPPVVDGINLNFTMSNSGSATQNSGNGACALFLSNVKNSHFNIETSNRLTDIGTHKMRLLVGFGRGVDTNSVLVTGKIDNTPGLVAREGATVTRVDSIVAAGSGYQVGDIVSLSGLSGTLVAANLQVTAVSGGVVTGVRQIGPSLYTSTPSGTIATTAVIGSGSGLTVTITARASASSLPGGLQIHDGSMPGWVSDNLVCRINGSGAPGAGTGNGRAVRGSQYTDLSNGDLYLNTGTHGSPNWKKVTAV